MPDDAPDVQPSGEGDHGSDSGLYDLSSVPEHLRPHVEPVVKEIQGNVTRRFQEAAEERKTFEPYQKLGVTDVPPERMEELIALNRLADDPEAFEQWWRQTGEQAGYLNGEDEEGDEDEQFNLADLDDDDVLTAAQVRELVSQEVTPVKESLSQREEQEQIENARAYVDQELDRLSEENKLELEDDDREDVFALSLRHDGPDAISKGFGDWQRLTAKGARDFVKDGLKQPDTAEQGGRPATQWQPPRTFEDAGQRAREMLAANHR